jgi:hypothetical protein
VCLRGKYILRLLASFSGSTGQYRVSSLPSALSLLLPASSLLGSVLPVPAKSHWFLAPKRLSCVVTQSNSHPEHVLLQAAGQASSVIQGYPRLTPRQAKSHKPQASDINLRTLGGRRCEEKATMGLCLDTIRRLQPFCKHTVAT